METSTARDVTAAEDVANALGVAWSMFTLYPDPSAQPAFARAVAELEDKPMAPIILELTSAGFSVAAAGGEPEATLELRDGAVRLARNLFVRDVERLRPMGGATAEGVLTLFRLVLDETVPASALESVPGSGVELGVRDQLELDGGDAPDVEDLDVELAALSSVALEAVIDTPPKDIATLIEEAANGPDDAAAMFIDAYHEVYGHVQPAGGAESDGISTMREGMSDPWQPARTMVETFFFLDRTTQIRAMRSILGDVAQPGHESFLDQLSGPDISGFLQDLDAASAEALLGFTQNTAVRRSGADGGAEAEDASAEEHPAGVSRLGDRLAGPERRPSRIDPADYGEFHEVPESFSLGINVMRGLMECEDRPERFRRVVRIWAARVMQDLRSEDYESAFLRLQAVLHDPPFPVESRPIVGEALQRIAGPELVSALAVHLNDEGPQSEAIRRVVGLLGEDLVTRLVAQLAVEEDPHVRRALTDLTALAAEPRPQMLEPYLLREPWYVVRNLATVLGKIGKRSAAGPLRRILHHEDHRVRVEALRSLVRVLRDDAPALLVSMLADDHDRVRRTALALLRTSESPRAADAVADALDGTDLGNDVALVLVELTPTWSTPRLRDVLEKLASRRGVFGANRTLRDAARTTLRGMR